MYNVSIKRKGLTTYWTAKKKLCYTCLCQRDSERSFNRNRCRIKSRRSLRSFCRHAPSQIKMVGNASVSFKMCQNKRILLGALGGGEVVWWLRQLSSSLLFRSLLGGGGDISRSSLFFFFLWVCLCFGEKQWKEGYWEVLNTCRIQDAVERQGRLENVWFRRQSF